VLKQDTNGKYYLFFDGVDDSLSTGSIDFTSTDKMTVFAGVRKLSDAARGMLVELNTSATSATFRVEAPNTAVTANYLFASGGSLGATGLAVTTLYSAPVTNVVTGIGDISGDRATMRISNAQVGRGTADQGTGNYGNYPLYIGSRAGTSLPFNGHIYSLIVRGAQSTDAQITSAERFVAGKTGVTLP
jgi:hypothetical protein